MISETDALIRIVIAAVLGAALGLERELSDKPAGLRTHMLVAEGSALFMVGSLLMIQEFAPKGSSPSLDPTRVASTIVTGIGFLGGGAILQSRDRVSGITTAAAIWVTAGVGLLVGAGFYLVAAGGVVIAIVTLALLALPERWIAGSRVSRFTFPWRESDDSSPPTKE